MQASAATLPIVPTTTVNPVTSVSLSPGMTWRASHPTILDADVATTVDETRVMDPFQVNGSPVLPRHAPSVRTLTQMMSLSILRALSGLREALCLPRSLRKSVIISIGLGELTVFSSSYRDHDRKRSPSVEDVRLHEIIQDMSIKVERMESTIASQRSAAQSSVNIDCSLHGSGRSSFFRRRRCICSA